MGARMKLKGMFAAALLALAACSTGAVKEQAAYDQMKAFADTELGAARAGQQPWAVAYTRLYEFAQQSPDPIIKQAMMVVAGHLIPFARARDQGAITAEQFDDAQRNANTAVETWVTAERQKSRQMRAQQEAEDNMRLSRALGGLATMSGGQPALAPTTNCTTSRNGAFLNTTCR